MNIDVVIRRRLICLDVLCRMLGWRWATRWMESNWSILTLCEPSRKSIQMATVWSHLPNEHLVSGALTVAITDFKTFIFLSTTMWPCHTHDGGLSRLFSTETYYWSLGSATLYTSTLYVFVIKSWVNAHTCVMQRTTLCWRVSKVN